MEQTFEKDHEAFDRGYNAGLNADELNPYPKRSAGALSWSLGYIEGEVKRKEARAQRSSQSK
ncbi:MAG: hypothetical protein V4525_10385 [Pseudomonadota bacterium]